MMNVGLESYPYPSARMPIMAPRGVVATSQPLAAQAGLSMLQRGGTAVDAALATAIALTVVEPTNNGIGSDAFALVWDGGALHGLNGSGRSPTGMTTESLRAAGHEHVPQRGWWTVTVPGAPRAWADLHQRFGRLPFKDLFEPAIVYAEGGYPVSPTVAHGWDTAARHVFAGFRGEEFKPWYSTFTANGSAPRAGQMWRSQAHAETLRRIAASDARDFYEGELAEAISAFAQQTGGPLRADDLAAHHSDWVTPLRVSYRGHEVWEIPPNGQGIAALIGLGILDGLELSNGVGQNSKAHPRESVESYHLQIEALKLGLTDAMRYVADPEHSDVPVEGLLDPAYLAERRALIGSNALDPVPGRARAGGTVYLCAADADGMMVSYIQSNYMGFGSGVVVPGRGIALHNRGADFVLDDQHPNRLAPGKRPFHTIIPGFLTREGQAVGPFGVMGAYMQAQGHMQMMVNTLDYSMNPQTSLDAPRWRWIEGRQVAIEPQVDRAILEGLIARGHQVVVDSNPALFGRGQIIFRLPGGGYVAGSEKRADGCAVGY
jgi:gamma-glutamyltranspeptidase/glutathione hydrolase